MFHQEHNNPQKDISSEYWRVERSCRFFQTEAIDVAAAVAVDFGDKEFLEGLAFG